jgi:hypothetical protein
MRDTYQIVLIVVVSALGPWSLTATWACVLHRIAVMALLEAGPTLLPGAVSMHTDTCAVNLATVIAGFG